MHVKGMELREKLTISKENKQTNMDWKISAKAWITEYADPSDERDERVKDGSTHTNRLAQNMTVILVVLTNLGELVLWEVGNNLGFRHVKFEESTRIARPHSKHQALCQAFAIKYPFNAYNYSCTRSYYYYLPVYWDKNEEVEKLSELLIIPLI